MTPVTTSFRHGIAEDAATISAFAERVFSDWYLPDNHPDDIDLHVATTYAPALQAAELADPAMTYLLAHVDGQLAAYALLRRNEPHRLVTARAPCAVVRFYVDRPWHGRGVAVALMQQAVATARASGAGALWLTAWERNPRAQAFYAKMGFQDVGTDTFVLGRAPQVDRLLVHALD